MGLTNELAQYRAWKNGVMHTTLNPNGPGAVRIHLVPPRWRLFGRRSYVVILNGYYVLPLGYSWALLLKNFILEVNRYAGEPMTEEDMLLVVKAAVKKTKHTYYDVSEQKLASDLGEMLDVLFAVVQGREPQSEIEAVSLREYAPNMTAPHRMDLMISAMTDAQGAWNCNLKCRHCYAAGQAGANGRELSTDEWKNIIDRCREIGIPQLTFTGGEPTRRGDLVELVAHAGWFVTRLNTNGVLLTPELCGKLKEASLDSVQITLYAAEADIHNRLVGAGLSGVTGNWEKTMTGLRNALAAGLDVSVNTPLCRDNAAYTRLLECLHGEGVRFVSCSGLIETGKAADGAPSAQLTEEEMDSILREAADYCRDTGMELSFTSPGRARPDTLKELGLTVPACGACLSNMAVTPDGTVVPCQSWLGEGVDLGNMLHTPWKRIWNHPTCRSIRAMDEGEALSCPLRAACRKGGEKT